MPVEYVIVAVPAETPVTTPEALPTVATPVVPEVHVPPVVASPKVVVAAVHIAAMPVIAPGAAITVTTATVLQPVARE